MKRWLRSSSGYTVTTGYKTRQAEKGLTLIELLVTVAIAGLLMAAVGSFIMASTRVQTAAVNQSSFMVKAQRLFSTMIDGKTGLISAKEYRLWGAQHGYQLALSYLVNVDGTDTVFSYQYADSCIYRSEPVVGSNLVAPSQVGTPVLTGVDQFIIDDSEAPRLSIRIASGSTILRTAVTLRN